jgi:hypothetical protein
MADPRTDELRVDQIRREHEEHARAQDADQEADEHAHERRADKASYLSEKLAERAESEERVERDA